MRYRALSLFSCLMILTLLVANIYTTSGQSVIQKQFYSDEFKQGFSFSWQITKFILNGTTVTSSGITTKNIVNGSIIQLHILKDLANFDVLNNTFAKFHEYYSIIIDDGNEYFYLDDKINFALILQNPGIGFGFPLVWATHFVYDNGSSLSFAEEINLRMGSSAIINLTINETVVKWTSDNSPLIPFSNSTQNEFVYNASTGLLLSFHHVDNSLNLDVTFTLIESNTSIVKDTTTTTSTTTKSSLTPGYTVFPILVLSIVVFLSRRMKRG